MIGGRVDVPSRDPAARRAHGTTEHPQMEGPYSARFPSVQSGHDNPASARARPAVPSSRTG